MKVQKKKKRRKSALYFLHLSDCVRTPHSNTIFNRRWAAAGPWQISTCVWDQCCCTCGSSPWSHSLCTITQHLRPCAQRLTDWLTGESHLTKSLSDWSRRLTWAPEGGWGGGGLACQGQRGPSRVNLSLCPPDTPRQTPPPSSPRCTRSCVVIAALKCARAAYQWPKTRQLETYTAQPADKKIN